MRKKSTLALLIATLLLHLFAYSQNVGIGTTTPLQKLHVSGGVLSDSIRIGNGQPVMRADASGPSLLALDLSAWNVYTSDPGPAWQSFTATANSTLDYVSLYYVNPAAIGELRIYDGEGTAGAILAAVMMPAAIPGFNNSPHLNIKMIAGQKYTIWVANRIYWTWQMGNPYAGGRASAGATDDMAFRVYTRDIVTLFQAAGTGAGHLLMNQPSSLINVNGSISTNTLRMTNGAGAGKILSSDQNGNAFWQPPASIAWGLNGNSFAAETRLGTISNHALPIITGNAEVARFHEDGRLSIGTATAYEKLTVQGNILATQSNSIYLGGITNNGNDGARIFNNLGSTFIDHRGNDNLHFRADVTNGSTTRMSISPWSGHIGVGMLPDGFYKFAVQGDIRATGGITAENGVTVQGNVFVMGGSIIQSPMSNPSLQNLWIHSPGYAAPGYYKGKDQRVYLQGTVSNGLGGSIFTLASDCRPAATMRFLVPANDSDGQVVITIDPSGIVFSSSTGFINVHLDGISFRVN